MRDSLQLRVNQNRKHNESYLVTAQGHLYPPFLFYYMYTLYY